MYRLLIPVMNRKMTERQKETLAAELSRAGADTVMVVFSRILRNENMLQEEVAQFRENRDFLQEKGFSVGAWLCPTVGYGGAWGGDNDAGEHYTRLTGADGGVAEAYCPLDDGFVADFLHNLDVICETGVKEIMFEDDFVLYGGKGLTPPACTCKRHMARYRERIGEEIAMDELRSYLLSGGKNRYRDAWAELMGETMIEFAKKIDASVHGKYPDVRIGLSANGTSYTLEGVDVPTLARIVAGKNRPFMRLTGAPYWQQTLSVNAPIEAIRWQSAVCGDDIEQFTEGDTYPRPRAWVSSARLEAYDMILRAAGGTHGILKYMIDYTAGADYETGYIDRHLKNAPHYAEIARRFAGKRAVGYNVLEAINTYPAMDFDGFTLEDHIGHGALPTQAQWMLTDASLPTCYGEEHLPTVAFTENAAYLTPAQRRAGVITDGAGARVLMRMGIDVGILSMEEKKPARPAAEYFPAEDRFVSCAPDSQGTVYEVTLKDSAVVESEFVRTVSGLALPFGNDLSVFPRYPASYYYENADGEKYLVFPYNPCTLPARSGWANGLYRSYARGRQLIAAYEKMAGRPLPAVCPGAPGAYILCMKDEHEMAVGLWNLSEDEILSPVISLDRAYETVDIYHASGHLRGNELVLDEDLPPYGFVLFTVK